MELESEGLPVVLAELPYEFDEAIVFWLGPAYLGEIG